MHLTITDWDNGMPAVVSAWNASHPDIQVQLIKPSGTGYTLYNKLITDNRAGTNPDISEVEYQALPEMVANKVAISLNKYLPNLSQSYPSSVTSLVQFQGQAYGVAQNICPMVFFYRKDVFAKLGPEGADHVGAVRHRRRGGSQGQPEGIPGQLRRGRPRVVRRPRPAGGRQLVDRQREHLDRRDQRRGHAEGGELLAGPGEQRGDQPGAELVDAVAHRHEQGQHGGLGFRPVGAQPVPDDRAEHGGPVGRGTLPAWTAGNTTVGTWGGEAEIVTASSKHPQQAAEFINWMNDSQQGLNLLIKNVSVFPAATFAQSSPELQTPPPFMSDQPGYNTLMASVAKGVRDFQIWGPDASVTFSSYSDAFASALQNHTPFTAALGKVQSATVSDMKNAGFQVTG